MNSKRACVYCKQSFARESGFICNVGFFCSAGHAAKYGMKKSLNQKQKQQRKEIREKKQALKTISQLKAEAQTAVNKYIRLRDEELGCISCDKPKEAIESEAYLKIGGAWDAGHFMSRGAKEQLRFNLLNIHKQCKKCNAGSAQWSHKAESVSKRYTKKLIDKIGLERVEALKCNNEIRRFERDYLVRVKVIFNKRCSIIKKIRRGA